MIANKKSAQTLLFIVFVHLITNSNVVIRDKIRGQKCLPFLILLMPLIQFC